MSAFNLPLGCNLSDVNGPPMPRCEQCGGEFNPERDETLCDDCLPEPGESNEDVEELLRASVRFQQVTNEMKVMARDGLAGTEKFQALWIEAERLKNINGGMPPENPWPDMPHLKPITTELLRIS